MQTTLQQYDKAIQACQKIFSQKHLDYGTSWRALRPSALTDQLLIKVKRIRKLQEQDIHKVKEEISLEMVGIVNYAVLALIQLSLPENTALRLPYEQVVEHYKKCIAVTTDLLRKKNQDYNEAWRQMRLTSIVDIIFMKLLRINAIEDLGGEPVVSEGVEAGYQDIINYAVFALIRLDLPSMALAPAE